MSVLIKGMKMPENGSCIQIVIDDDGNVYSAVEKCIMKMGSIAKAVPVPPHGDLIDRDKLREKEFIHDGDAYAVVMSRDIRNAPTIIPASE